MGLRMKFNLVLLLAFIIYPVIYLVFHGIRKGEAQ